MKPLVVVITGLSGSGKTVALRTLEDKGFFCVDNLPVALIESFVSIVAAGNAAKQIGIGIDVREKEFLRPAGSVLTSLRKTYNLEVIFFEADRDSIVRRFKETRRPHPLVSGEITIEDAIIIERTLLSPMREDATRIIDTSSFTPHQLRQFVASLYRHSEPDNKTAVTFISFGYKFGVPQNVDLLFDVRFIPNPHFIPELKPLRGTDRPVQDFVLKSPVTAEFIEKTTDMLNFLIPQYVAEGKTYLTVGFGCTGGRHRSPAIVEETASRIKNDSITLTLIHRDIDL